MITFDGVINTQYYKILTIFLQFFLTEFCKKEQINYQKKTTNKGVHLSTNFVTVIFENPVRNRKNDDKKHVLDDFMLPN